MPTIGLANDCPLKFSSLDRAEHIVFTIRFL